MDKETPNKPSPPVPVAQTFDATKFVELLTQKWKGKPCPMCNSGPWNVTPEIFEVRQYYGGSFVLAGKIAPLVAVTCANCGNTILVNALTTGLIKMEGQ